MPVNNYSVGRDVSLVLVGASGIVSLGLITGFSSKQGQIDIKIRPLNSAPVNLVLPDGWTGSFKLERQDSSADDYFANLENNYYAGLNNLPLQINETIQESSGITQYRYTQVYLKFDDTGDWAGDKSVPQSVSFVASRRQKIQ